MQLGHNISLSICMALRRSSWSLISLLHRSKDLVDFLPVFEVSDIVLYHLTSMRFRKSDFISKNV